MVRRERCDAIELDYVYDPLLHVEPKEKTVKKKKKIGSDWRAGRNSVLA